MGVAGGRASTVIRVGFALAMLAGRASAAEFYEGWWAAHAEWCRNVTRDGDEIPIVLGPRSMSGLENECEFTSVKKAGRRWDVQATCDAEGERYRESWTFARVGDKLAITWAAGDTPTTFVRCNEPSTSAGSSKADPAASSSGTAGRRVAEVGRPAPRGSYLELSLYKFCVIDGWQNALVKALSKRGLPAFHGQLWRRRESPFDVVLLKRSPGALLPTSSVFLGPLIPDHRGTVRALETTLKEASRGQLETIPTGPFDLLDGGQVDCFEVERRDVPEATSGTVDGLAAESLRVWPGHGIGTVGFGDARSKVLGVLGQPLLTSGTNVDVQEGTAGLSLSAGRRWDEWASEYGTLELEYLGDKVKRITFWNTPRARTTNGFSMADGPVKFREQFPKSEKRCIRSGGSGGESTSTRYTDESSGIAFEVTLHGEDPESTSLVVFPVGERDVGAESMEKCS